MSPIIVDDEFRKKLHGLSDGAEFRDIAGTPIGFFVTPERYRDLVYAWLRAGVSDDEIERARQQEDGRSLQQILQDLERK